MLPISCSGEFKVMVQISFELGFCGEGVKNVQCIVHEINLSLGFSAAFHRPSELGSGNDIRLDLGG